MNLRGRTALVTGGAHRVGGAIAEALAREGMRVAISYNSSSKLADEFVARMSAEGHEVFSFSSDLGASGAPERLAADVIAKLGGLELLVNSAAVMQRTPVGSVTYDQWDAMFALNLRAPFFLAQALHDALAASGEGAVVNMADLAAMETWPAYVPHGISKAGVIQMTRSLARTFAPKVRVNAIAPGAVLLPDGWGVDAADHLRSTTPLRRLGSPSDVVEALLYLARAEYVTGETIVVDGGRHVRA